MAVAVVRLPGRPPGVRAGGRGLPEVPEVALRRSASLRLFAQLGSAGTARFGQLGMAEFGIARLGSAGAARHGRLGSGRLSSAGSARCGIPG